MSSRPSIEAVRLAGDHRAQSAYSPAIRAGDFVFVSGIGPLSPDAEVVGSDIDEQSGVTLDNLAAVLEAAGASFSQLVMVRVYLNSIGDYDRFNRVYERYVLEPPYPARICLQAGLWEGVLVEVEATVFLG